MIRDAFDKNGKPASPALVKFLRAVESGDLEKVRDYCRPSLINARFPGTGDTALIIAARAGHLDVLRFLLRKEADVDATNDRQSTALYEAAKARHAGCVDRLLKAGAQATSAANPWIAAFKGSEAIVDLLLSANVSLTLPFGPERHQPLHLAAAAGCLPIVRKLLAAGAPTRARNAQGMTPLDIARAKGYTATLALLAEEDQRRNKAYHDGTGQKVTLMKPLQYRKPS